MVIFYSYVSLPEGTHVFFPLKRSGIRLRQVEPRHPAVACDGSAEPHLFQRGAGDWAATKISVCNWGLPSGKLT